MIYIGHGTLHREFVLFTANIIRKYYQFITVYIYECVWIYV